MKVSIIRLLLKNFVLDENERKRDDRKRGMNEKWFPLETKEEDGVKKGFLKQNEGVGNVLDGMVHEMKRMHRVFRIFFSERNPGHTVYKLYFIK